MSAHAKESSDLKRRNDAWRCRLLRTFAAPEVAPSGRPATRRPGQSRSVAGSADGRWRRAMGDGGPVLSGVGRGCRRGGAGAARTHTHTRTKRAGHPHTGPLWAAHTRTHAAPPDRPVVTFIFALQLTIVTMSSTNVTIYHHLISQAAWNICNLILLAQRERERKKGEQVDGLCIPGISLHSRRDPRGQTGYEYIERKVRR